MSLVIAVFSGPRLRGGAADRGRNQIRVLRHRHASVLLAASVALLATCMPPRLDPDSTIEAARFALIQEGLARVVGDPVCLAVEHRVGESLNDIGRAVPGVSREPLTSVVRRVSRPGLLLISECPRRNDDVSVVSIGAVYRLHDGAVAGYVVHRRAGRLTSEFCVARPSLPTWQVECDVVAREWSAFATGRRTMR